MALVIMDVFTGQMTSEAKELLQKTKYWYIVSMQI